MLLSVFHGSRKGAGDGGLLTEVRCFVVVLLVDLTQWWGTYLLSRAA